MVESIIRAINEAIELIRAGKFKEAHNKIGEIGSSDISREVVELRFLEKSLAIFRQVLVPVQRRLEELHPDAEKLRGRRDDSWRDLLIDKEKMREAMKETNTMIKFLEAVRDVRIPRLVGHIKTVYGLLISK